jgi:glycosyltransferase involved in cell wall biosynthesis
MSPARPRLAIAIPTYNRAALLADCLASVLPQAAAAGAEVVVSDNASTDGTQALLESLAKGHPCLRVFRNERNLGGRANIWLAPARATAEWVWMLGDDDLLDPVAIERVLAQLAAAPPDLRLLFLRERRIGEHGDVVNAEGPARDTDYPRGIDIVADFAWGAFAQISRLVVPRDAWVATQAVYESYPAAWGCPQLSSLVDLLATGPARFVAEPLLRVRPSDLAWFVKAGPMLWCYEYPWLYAKAEAKGLPASVAERWRREHWRVVLRQFAKVELFDAYYEPRLAELWRAHGAGWYFGAVMVPVHLASRALPSGRWRERLARRLSPAMHVPTGKLHEPV